ncbi:8-amino-7-oxononanoate synthase [Aliivibrio finisterrensis]|uniref:8-amino-7-oxononanoate synthase n=1 Tax=Aliivibrio finisterrensis TaxID=511998 RepID=UPI001022452D|nr:8-amino-7-oxononanoate synthase [Aliivibrio finisterrensis]RYU70574.1 8-amino-7-oxononanoate synthase [Aliivibrio finisterrensis]RYU74436.1 8-amino-7-oxononanoate synthase [Aliivibrio finisterrensis]RYU77042.1 8-amino-7-oxononanoate synthase [Aliivibrio finisterrensis]
MKRAFNQRISSALTQRKQAGLNRSRTVIEQGNQSRLVVDGQSYINFSGNDYLGLAGSKELTQAWQQGLSLYGSGSGASPLVTGYSKPHADLESQLAEWLGFDCALLFNSGFSANQAVLFSLLEKGDTLLQDKLNHASLMEAGILSPATMKRFKHNDISHLTKLLTMSDNSPSLVVTEGVFSMDGDLSPLSDIAKVAKETNAWLMVDDAHGCGVLGNNGRGCCDFYQVTPDILIVTFGKGFGLSGAAVLCNHECGDYLAQFARHHVYSTAMPPAQAHALSHALLMIQQQEWRRGKLKELNQQFESELTGFLGAVKTNTPIKPIIIGEADKAMNVSTALKNQGLWTTAIRPPTVPTGTARLRITLSANHSQQDITQLTQAITELG